MPASWLFSLLFFAVGTILLASGIFALQSSHKASANRVFFALSAAITIWSSGMALSVIASEAAVAETWRRVSAIGWGTAYAILLHFIFIITGEISQLKVRGFILYLYLPALVTVFAFSVPNGINPVPYQLYRTEYGWLNVAEHNMWDWIFYTYYIGYTVAGLFLLRRWGRKAACESVKKQSRTIFAAILSGLILGTFTDVILSSMFSELPQMAPVIMLIPVLSIYHVLQRDSFGISEAVDKKTSYMSIFVCILVYLILFALQIRPSDEGVVAFGGVVGEYAVRGIIVQIQMFISIYLVLKENRQGYIVSIMINAVALLSATAVLIRSGSAMPLPGVISYSGVIVIITLIKAYKEKNAAYIKRINTQAIKEKFFSEVFSQAPVGIAVINNKKHTRNAEFEGININPMYEKIMGRTKDELQDITWPEITHPDDLKTDLKYFERFIKGEIDHYSLEKRFIKPDGSYVWVDMLVAPFNISNGKPIDHFCIISDITKRKKAEAALKFNSEHVMLTGLYNRSTLEKVLERDTLKPAAVNRALIYINLLAINELNMRYGFRYVQNMLKMIAKALGTYCSDRYTLFNTNENRFVFYVKGYEGKKELTEFCKAVAGTLNSYLYVHGTVYRIGVLEIDESQAEDIEELQKKLLMTIELAPKNSFNDDIILFYGPEVDEKIARENEISQQLTEIASGLNTDRLFLQYQPILDISTGLISGFEALARLKNEKYGLLAPSEFIHIAEKNNIIVPLGEVIMLLTFRFLKRLKENKLETVSVSINISTAQLLKEGFSDKLLDMIIEMQLNPETIGLELTESVFADEREEINSAIDSLKKAGLKILIDDFGTGYSSLARERELNVDCLKIDKSFIDKLLVLKPEETITGDIISMVHKLGHCVVAEGVEHASQLEYLRERGCDKIQGHLISRPLDEEDALVFLMEYAKTI